jgi:GDP-4-dehydro-6-deoxy-D-mannose reductase
MRAFLTGGHGFVGGWLARHLADSGDEVVLAPEGLDVRDAAALDEALARAEPEVVFHLAARTHVGASWSEPALTFEVNALGTLQVLEAARKVRPLPRVVLVSSSEVYGRGTGEALTEDAPLQPVTPYAASKVAAEYLGVQAGLGHGLEVVRVRPFNHVGPGQRDDFVVSALARRVVEAERKGEDVLRVGNLDAARDFTDVRDVVRAYRLVALGGEPGAVYNVCSGVATPISVLARLVAGLARRPVRLEVDPALLRPVDVPVLVGDPGRLVARTGWKPEIPLETTVVDVLEDWRSRLV